MNGYTLDGGSSIVEISGTQYDAAYNLSGGKLRTPTRKEFKELIDRCRWSWTTYNGATGCKITGPSGKSIFCLVREERVTMASIERYIWILLEF